jgi:hypothetical protein
MDTAANASSATTVNLKFFFFTACLSYGLRFWTNHLQSLCQPTGQKPQLAGKTAVTDKFGRL